MLTKPSKDDLVSVLALNQEQPVFVTKGAITLKLLGAFYIHAVATIGHQRHRWIRQIKNKEIA